MTAASSHTILRVIRGRPNLFIGAACGLLAWPLLVLRYQAQTAAVMTWDIGVIVYLALTFAMYLRVSEPRQMADNAAAQETGEWTVFWLTVLAASASFAAIISEFAALKDAHGLAKAEHLGLVVATLVVSWLMAHVTFATRYAHEYYEIAADGAGYRRGLTFPGEEHPDYMDFCYYAVVLGMTFQTSDISITDRYLRRLSLVHSFLAFLFNTIIIALTVNLAAGLL